MAYIKLRFLLENYSKEEAISVFRRFGVDPMGKSQAELKDEFRRLAVAHHPDRGGDSEAMKSINAAWDVLKDIDFRPIQSTDDLPDDGPAVPDIHTWDMQSDYGDEDSPPRGYNFGASHSGNANYDINVVIKIDEIRVSEEDANAENAKFQQILRKFIEKKAGLAEATKKYFPQCYQWVVTEDSTYFMTNFRHELFRIFQFRDQDDPVMMKTYETLRTISDKLVDRSITTPDNPAAYPAFVTLYDRTESYGGDEEGGWFYKNMEVHVTSSGKKASKQVKNYEEAQLVAEKIFEAIQEVEGQPVIILERETGIMEDLERPQYS